MTFQVVRLTLIVAALCMPAACAIAGEHSTGKRYADECEAWLGDKADPNVFGAELVPDEQERAAGIAFETDIYSLSSGLKQRPRPDVHLIVLTSDESRGFFCEYIGAAGYSVARVSTFGGATDVVYARRISETRVAIMNGNGEQPEQVELYHDVLADSVKVARMYPSDAGDVPAPGLSMTTGPDKSLAVCDHRGGLLRTFDVDGHLLNYVRYGCENHQSEEAYEPNPPQRYIYDARGNVIEERWSDELGRPGRTRYLNTLNDRADWTQREFQMKTADDSEYQRIREEYRFMRYRDETQ